MIITEKTGELAAIISGYRSRGKSIGLVPTMGALHDGHLSLIGQSRKQNDITVTSIFVNPTQFTEDHDFMAYPRTIAKDIELLNKMSCDLLFAPATEEIYPHKDQRVFSFNGLDAIMEGASRPGHFNGVAQIVTRLFELTGPDRAYFGEKDFQQLVIIRFITRLMNYPVEIVSCPIIREHDELAMSSRNQLLTPEQRHHASILPQTLTEAKKMWPFHSIREVKEHVSGKINSNREVQLDYFEIVDSEDLKPLTHWQQATTPVGCIAVRVGNVRLIDNIKFS